MVEDTETEVEMLKSHLQEAWGIVGDMECEVAVRAILTYTIGAMFFLCYWRGPDIWMMWVILAGCVANVLFTVMFQSHFSKKYMRLANGE